MSRGNDLDTEVMTTHMYRENDLDTEVKTTHMSEGMTLTMGQDHAHILRE